MSNKSSLTPLLPDNPISSSEEDILEWVPIATNFTRRILKIDATRGLVVGLFGTWGSGKTSFINLARPTFQEEGISVLDFNPWLFSGADQLLERFFSELSAEMSETSNLEEIASYLFRYGEVISKALRGISRAAGISDAGMNILDLIKSALKKPEMPVSAIASRRKLTQALTRLEKPIVVVLDDVDRLTRNEIRELFKLVRVTASFPNLIYIVACDRVRVEQALDDSDTAMRGNYMEKIFQWSIDIPAVSRERIRQQLVAGVENALGDIPPPFDEKDWPDIEAEIIRPLLRNMRDVRRYSMAVRGTVDDLGTSIAVVDTFALEAIRLFMPRLFRQLPDLIDHLTVPPTWEANVDRTTDIVSEQMGDSQNSAERRRAHLKDVLSKIDAKDQPVARALIHRVFSGGRDHINNQDSEWKNQQLRNKRVAHRIMFRIYLTRVDDGDLVCSTTAKRAFDRMHDAQALDSLMRLQEPDSCWKIILLLWSMFENEFERRHVEPALVIFWNLLSEMPGGSSRFSDKSMLMIRTISDSLLKTLIGMEGAVHLIDSVFRQLQSLTSKVVLIEQIRALKKEECSIISDDEIQEIESRLNNQILSVDEEELAVERHPATILLFSAQYAAPSGGFHIVHDSPKLTYALLRDCRTVSSSGEIGRRAIEMEQAIHWDSLIAVYGSRKRLQSNIQNLDRSFSTIESWIVSELKDTSSDAQYLLQLAKTTVDDEPS